MLRTFSTSAFRFAWGSSFLSSSFHVVFLRSTWSDRSLALRASFSCSWIRLIRGSNFRESRVITAKRERMRPDDSVDGFPSFFFFPYVVYHHGLATANKVSLERNTREIVIPVAALIDLSGHSKLSSCQSCTRNHRIPLSPLSVSQCGRDQEQRCLEEMPEPENGVVLLK